MDEDGFSFGEKKGRSAKTGRRAKKEAEPPPPAPASADVDEGDADEEVMATPTGNDTRPSRRDTDGPPRPARKMSGWGEESVKRRSERLKPQTPENDEDSDNDIPVIPDLEDQQEEDLTTQIAMAPNVAVNRVATYRELDNDLLRHAAFLTLDNDTDLKLLSKGLSAEADVQEEDKPWDWDRLFTEVTSELLTEWERKEQPDDEAPVA